MEFTRPARRLPPEDWGSDPLSSFLEVAHQNRWATFVNKRASHERLVKIDGCFEKMFHDAINPRPWLPMHLFLRSHAAFRAACGNVLAGQTAETFPMIRMCLEFAAYGLHIVKNAGLDEVWLGRHDDEASLKAAKKAFVMANVRGTIEKTNRKALEVFDTLYQQSIDMGGHANERAVTGNMDIIEGDDRKEFRQIYLHGDSLQLDHALLSVTRAGVCALEIFQEAYPARFELLGIRYDILKLRSGL